MKTILSIITILCISDARSDESPQKSVTNERQVQKATDDLLTIIDGAKFWKIESVLASSVLPGNGESKDVVKARGDLRVEVKIRNITKNPILINSCSSPFVQLSPNESVTKTEIDKYFRTFLNSNGQMCGPARYTSIAPNETYSFFYRDSSLNEGKQMNLTFIGKDQSNIKIGPYTLKQTKKDNKSQ